jgi:hypothetical protein
VSFLLITDSVVLFDGGENELENEWLYNSATGISVSISVNRFIDSPLHTLIDHVSNADFDQLLTDVNARKNLGISHHYCNQHGLELFWLKELFITDQLLVIVSFGEVNAGRYRLMVEGEVEMVG